MIYTLEQTQYTLDHLYSHVWEDYAPSYIHNLSLEVAELFNEAYNTEDATEDTSALLEAFRGLRRELPLDDAGKRYGAAEAYEWMHGGPSSNG